jgi:polyhydroxyalkanoate synthase
MTRESDQAEGNTTAFQFEQELELILQRYTLLQQMLATLPAVPTGQTPRELIWTRNKARLYHYLPQCDQRYPLPILLVYSLMNKPYILDLRPGSSLIEYLLQQGYAIYLLDWGIPGYEDADLQIDDYVLEYLPRALRHTLDHAHAPALTLLGYCLGATLATCFTALSPNLPIKNLITMTIPLDFSEKSLVHAWLDPATFEVDTVVAGYKLIPGEMLDFGVRLLKPYQNFIGAYKNFWNNLPDQKATEAWLSTNKWASDVVPWTGATFKQWVKDFYQANKLVKGELVLRGQPVQLSQIKVNLLNILAARDHIVPASQSKTLLGLVSSPDKQEIILPGGHIGLVVGRGASKELWPALHHWLSMRSS